MVSSDTKCANMVIPCDIGARQRHGHDVLNEEIRLAKDETPGVQIHIELIHRRVMAGGRLDEGDLSFQLGERRPRVV